MSFKTSFQCTICTVETSSPNTEWRIVARRFGSFVLTPWCLRLAMRPDTQNVCSQQCAHAALSRFLDARDSIPASAPALVLVNSR